MEIMKGLTPRKVEQLPDIKPSFGGTYLISKPSHIAYNPLNGYVDLVTIETTNASEGIFKQVELEYIEAEEKWITAIAGAVEGINYSLSTNQAISNIQFAEEGAAYFGVTTNQNVFLLKRRTKLGDVVESFLSRSTDPLLPLGVTADKDPAIAYDNITNSMYASVTTDSGDVNVYNYSIADKKWRLGAPPGKLNNALAKTYNGDLYVAGKIPNSNTFKVLQLKGGDNWYDWVQVGGDIQVEGEANYDFDIDSLGTAYIAGGDGGILKLYFNDLSDDKPEWAEMKIQDYSGDIIKDVKFVSIKATTDALYFGVVQGETAVFAKAIPAGPLIPRKEKVGSVLVGLETLAKTTIEAGTPLFLEVAAITIDGLTDLDLPAGTQNLTVQKEEADITAQKAAMLVVTNETTIEVYQYTETTTTLPPKGLTQEQIAGVIIASVIVAIILSLIIVSI